jgi:hypothetical protein
VKKRTANSFVLPWCSRERLLLVLATRSVAGTLLSDGDAFNFAARNQNASPYAANAQPAARNHLINCSPPKAKGSSRFAARKQDCFH